MTNGSRARWLLPLVAIALLVAACGDDDTVDTGPGASPPGAGENGAVVQITVDGGFVPVEVSLRTVPVLTILSDGTAITPAPITMIYPGPALAPLQAGTMSPADVDALLDRARDLGLLDEPLDFGHPTVTDLPTTRVTITADGRTVQHEAYALEEDSGVDADQSENRRRLRDFIAEASGGAPGDRIWSPDALAVTVIGPYTADADTGAQAPVDWPLATAPETGDGFPCTLVDGPDVDTLLAALGDANELTPWVIDGEEYSLAFRPVVPGSAGCP